MTAHIESKKNEIAKRILLPGDPLRAKYIAEKFLENSVQVNRVRGMFGYTGTYKNKQVTVFATGMGMPSIGIYAYELAQFYDAEKMIRIGTCGTYHKDIHIKDVLLASSSYTKSSYPLLFFEDNENEFYANKNLNQTIKQVAKDHSIPLREGCICTSDIFDPYVEMNTFLTHLPKEKEILAFEMEAAALFAIGKHLNRQTACLLTVVDSSNDEQHLSREERERALDEMIQLALDAIVL